MVNGRTGLGGRVRMIFGINLLASCQVVDTKFIII